MAIGCDLIINYEPYLIILPGVYDSVYFALNFRDNFFTSVLPTIFLVTLIAVLLRLSGLKFISREVVRPERALFEKRPVNSSNGFEPRGAKMFS